MSVKKRPGPRSWSPLPALVWALAGMTSDILILRCALTAHDRLYENAPSLYPSPLDGGGVGMIFIFRCVPFGHDR
ncbi:MAG: hypothetical protein COZ70_09595 [Deltaproteobacteria bacterium CG_4_8_14_3_um_filter_51_11]|nr:MAG: hypothetical protein COZ70_09595 [Deltaproteobacteria bacterium CG_4_8_14_3_um_filter_51_11]PIY24393.1 MAG: hypothetical protein COZ11_07635 [Deltaproteobacteria bacterium CG_4_10_14_3_um_filter_51_14]